jgi:hypothetical protein
MASRKKVAFLGRGYTRLDRDEQDYMRTLARSLLIIQVSRDLVVEDQGKKAVITAKNSEREPEIPIKGGIV